MTEKGTYGEPWGVALPCVNHGGMDCIIPTTPTPGVWYPNGKPPHVWVSSDRRVREDNQSLADRVVACVNALDGYDPEKLGAFLEASAKLYVAQDGFRSVFEYDENRNVWRATFDALMSDLTGGL